jgi:hypothetical protein
MKKSNAFSAAALVVVLMLAAACAWAVPVTFSGQSGTLSALVTFDRSGSNLLVTLANTSTSDVMVPANVLTAVFFDLAGDPTLTRTSAILTPGSTVLFGTTDPGNVVGGEWAYNKGFAFDPNVGRQGISSVGLDLFGPHDRFPGNDLQPPDSPDGLQYGITSPVDDPNTGNTPVTEAGKNALIKSSVDFVLGGLPTVFDPNTDITKVYFQYGTDLSDPRFPGDRPPDYENPPVPEPLTVAAVSLAVGSVGAYVRRRRKS